MISSVHGGDFTTAGPKSSLDWFRAKLEEQYELKEAARLGPSVKDDHEGRVLNRIVRWNKEGLSYEADPRHSEILAQSLAHGERPVTTPAQKRKSEKHRFDTGEEEEEEKMMTGNDEELLDDQGLLPTRLPWPSTAWPQIPPPLWRAKGDLCGFF